MTSLRRSPLADLHVAGESVIHAGMAVPAGGGLSRLPPVAMADCSMLPKFGCKGAVAADWLSLHDLPVPTHPNHWLPHCGGLIVRLGTNEYLFEAGTGVDWVTPLAGAERPAELIPVLRRDASLLLAGARIHELLLQVCSYDFAALDADSRPLVMTLMLGVTVLVIPLPGEIRAYRLWCDPSYGPYLYRTLLGIAHELGGGAIGWRDVADHLPIAIASDSTAPAPRGKELE